MGGIGGEGGTTVAGGLGGSGGAGGEDAVMADAPSGCSCGLAGSRLGSSGGLGAFALLALVSSRLGARRRRRG
jgi:hypothetical protein